MRSMLLCSMFLLGIASSILQAQDADDPLSIALTQGACIPGAVIAADRMPDGTIRAICDDEPTAFLPLLGGLAPVLGVGAAVAAAAAVAGGNSTPDTQ